MKERLFNIEVDNITMDECVEKIDYLISSKKKGYVVTPNVDHIVKLQEDKEFRSVYKSADLVVADGMPLIWYSKLIRRPLKEKISGSDLFPKICELASKKNYSIFLLGAKEGVALEAAKKLQDKYKGLKIAGCYSPPFGFEKNISELKKIIKIINDSNAEILAVGLGAPKQEKFIYRNINELNVLISLAIGATIDFEAGNIKRAPKWMQRCGLEWFYRFLMDPKRLFKRYFIEDIKFISIVFRDIFLKNK